MLKRDAVAVPAQSLQNRDSGMRQPGFGRLLLCVTGIALSMVLPCCGLEPMAASAPAPISQSAPQPASAPQTAASAAKEALAKLKAAKADPPYYVDFPHGQGVLLRRCGAPYVHMVGASSRPGPAGVQMLISVIPAVQSARQRC